MLLSPIMFQKQESLQVVIYVVRFSLEKTPGGQEVRRVLNITERTAFTNTVLVYCRGGSGVFRANSLASESPVQTPRHSTGEEDDYNKAPRSKGSSRTVCLQLPLRHGRIKPSHFNNKK